MSGRAQRIPATSRATFASASSNEEAAPPFRSVASFEKSNRLLNSLPVFPKSKSEMVQRWEKEAK